MVARAESAARVLKTRLQGVGPVSVADQINQHEVDWIMARVILLLVTLVFAVPPASAEIFKCVAKDGTDLYQNFPCGIDAIGSMATNAPSEKAGLAPGSSRQAQSTASVPAAAAVGRSPIMPGEPRVGMTVEEVRAVWGEPVETEEDELRKGRIEIWRYADGRSVQFNQKHRVLTVQR
jgi:hypothetical protein